MIIMTDSEIETMSVGEQIGRTLSPGAVVALRGELGAGKTAFTRGLAAGLGVDFPVTSPTFTIVNEYPGTLPLFHFDAYRLKDERELFDIGWDDYLDRNGVCAIEWSENVPQALPPGAIVVEIEILGETKRRLTIFPL